jgi:hypothetical protein
MNRVSAPVAPPSRSTASRLTASLYLSNLACSQPPSASPNSLNDNLQLYYNTHMIMASKFAQSWGQSASPSLHNHVLQHLWIHSVKALQFIPKLTQPLPQGLHYSSIQLHLQTHSITASICISQLAPWWPTSSHHHGLQAHLQTGSITTSKYIFMQPLHVYW